MFWNEMALRARRKYLARKGSKITDEQRIDFSKSPKIRCSEGGRINLSPVEQQAYTSTDVSLSFVTTVNFVYIGTTNVCLSVRGSPAGVITI